MTTGLKTLNGQPAVKMSDTLSLFWGEKVLYTEDEEKTEVLKTRKLKSFFKSKTEKL